MFKQITGTACALALACGNAVDAGTDGGWRDAPAANADPTQPQTLFHGSERVVTFTVDDTTLFALLQETTGLQLELVSCPMERCASERTTLFRAEGELENGQLRATPLVLAGGALYWLTRARTAGTGIASCPTSGCPQGPELVVEGEQVLDFTSDGSFVYWLDDGSNSLLRRSVERDSPVELLHEYSWDATWWSGLNERGEYLYLNDRDRVLRIRKDGVGGVLVIGEGLNVAGVSVSGEDVYFANSVLNGALSRCPLEGCSGTAHEVAVGQRWPAAPRVDASGAFWLNVPPSLGRALGDLETCALPACSKVDKIAKDISFGFPSLEDHLSAAFAVNQTSVFWRTDDLLSTFWIRRLPR
jgi:hypothetical protein